MNSTLDNVIRQIENLPDHEKTDPRKGLLLLREHCAIALNVMQYSANFSNEERAIQSTIWMVDSIVGSGYGFDRWLLFVLRSKKAACASLLRKYLAREEHQLEFALHAA